MKKYEYEMKKSLIPMWIILASKIIIVFLAEMTRNETSFLQYFTF